MVRRSLGVATGRTVGPSSPPAHLGLDHSKEETANPYTAASEPSRSWALDVSEDRRFLSVGWPRPVRSEDFIGDQGHPGERDNQSELIQRQQSPAETHRDEKDSEGVTHR